MEKLQSQVPIIGTNSLTIQDFWAWAYSDILSNANRGVFAEFLVGSALGAIDSPRIEWDSVDLRYREKAIEVKAAAYCQSWFQTRLSRITFSIDAAYSWDAATNTYRTEASRASDCYVFCLYTEQAPEKARESLLDVTRWDFFVITTVQLNTRFGNQKSIGLKSLCELCKPVPYESLKSAVDQALGLTSDDESQD